MGKKIVSFVLAALTVLMALNITVLAGERNYDSEQVHVIIENTVAEEDGEDIPWSGILVDEWVDIDDIYDDPTMMSSIVFALEKKGYSQIGAESGYISDIEGLEEFDAGPGSGWMGTLNNWFVNEGFQYFKVFDGDEIRVMYTCERGADISGGVGGGTEDKAISEILFSIGELNTKFDSGITEYVLTVPGDTEEIYVTAIAALKTFQVRSFSSAADEDYRKCSAESYNTKVKAEDRGAFDTGYKVAEPLPLSQSGDTVIKVVCGDKNWPSMNQSSSDPMVYTFTVKKETAEPKTGDIDGNGKIENKDVVLLFKYISKMKVEVKEEALDVNGDGIVNNKDVIRLFNLASEN